MKVKIKIQLHLPIQLQKQLEIQIELSSVNTIGIYWPYQASAFPRTASS